MPPELKPGDRVGRWRVVREIREVEEEQRMAELNRAFAGPGHTAIWVSGFAYGGASVLVVAVPLIWWLW